MILNMIFGPQAVQYVGSVVDNWYLGVSDLRWSLTDGQGPLSALWTDDKFKVYHMVKYSQKGWVLIQNRVSNTMT